MPTSQFFQLNEIIQLITLTNPYRILDIGIGFGKYGYLSREYLEIRGAKKEYQQRDRRIDGIEVYEKYITPVHKYIYDNIYIGNALNIIPTLTEKYDLILLIDVFEHFDYSDGMDLLENCRKISKNILISVPLDWDPQGEVFENEFERHKFYWKRNHFNKYKDKFYISNVFSLIIFLGIDAQQIFLKYRLSNNAVWKRKIIHFLDFLHLKSFLKSITIKRK